ncbi:transcriptional regulator [Lasius niger]|uniref:Transcriptional regulator n=1 Tax=Lasius niger TaxID=67767 RepID=A0A0J7K1E4_LASNI|nr:transcriptional regulator [Lasius niger]
MPLEKTSSARRQPQQQRGLKRVERLLASAAEVFAKHGYAAATMTEIAAKARASIGSLYQFFPNKHSLAIALLERYDYLLMHNFKALAARAADLTIAQLAASLLHQLSDLKCQREAVLALLTSPGALGEQRKVLRQRLESGIIQVLLAHTPGLAPETCQAIAQWVAIQLKAAAALPEGLSPVQVAAIYRELGEALQLYLQMKLPHSVAQV